MAFLHVFDCPDMTSDNQPERFRASLPTQSLALLNNPLVMRTSKAFAQEVLEKSKNNYEEAVKLAFDEAYNRPPTAERTGDRDEIDRRGAGPAGGPAPVHPGDVRRQQLPVQLLIAGPKETNAMRRFLTRRQALQEAAVGFGAMAVNSMLQRDALFAAESASAKERIYDLKPKLPHFAPKAKRVIFIYIGGGPSTIDMFDPKPALMKYDGKPAPFEIKGRALNGSQQIMASPWKFANCGQSGRQVSELLPYFQKVVDKVTFVRSMTTDRIDHSTAQFTFVTGRGFTGFPSIGSWVSYALGSENQNLPAYIALGQGATIGDRAHSSAWLPPIFNGTSMRADPKTPIYDIKRPDGMSLDQQRRLLDTVQALNRDQKTAYPLDQELESRIANYELAARMQVEALKVADLDRGERSHQEALRHRRQSRRAVRPSVPDGPPPRREGRALRPGLRRRRRQLGHAQQHRRPASRPVRVHRSGHVGAC